MDETTGLPIVGMVGAGQLARMTQQAAIALGQSLQVLADGPNDSAALVVPETHLGPCAELATLQDFAANCTVVTFDHEHVPLAHLQILEADGVTCYPSPDALQYAQDKVAMRERLSAAGFPVPPWIRAPNPAAVAEFGAKYGWPVVAKAPRGGYDGKGVWFIDAPSANGTESLASYPVLLEQRVSLRRELAALVARSPYGQVAAWPIVETVQYRGVCVEVLAPAPKLADEQATAAQRLAIEIAHELGVVGVLAVELFETSDGALLVNELAMRPHNSGHWTIDGAATSQFEQHLRAILDYPLGHTAPLAPATAMANVLGGPPARMSLDERLHHLFAADPGVKVHLYGKQPRLGRKLGHVTVLDDDMATARSRAVAAAQWLSNPVERSEQTHGGTDG